MLPVSKNTFIDIQQLSEELDEVTKLRNVMMNHYSLSHDEMDKLHIFAADAVIKEYDEDNRGLSLTELIKVMKEASMIYPVRGRFKESITLPEKLHIKAMKDEITDHITTIVVRMALLNHLIHTVSQIDDWAVKCSGAAKDAGRVFNAVKTNIGWHNNIEVVSGTPGNIEVEERTNTHYRGSTNIYYDAKIEVDGNWLRDVKGNNIEIVDIGGKECMPMWATEILDHDLLDQDVRLFETEVVYTKVPYDYDRWASKSGDWQKILHTEKRVVAVQSLASSKPVITTGKDKSWAVRTMKARMKKKMAKMMGIV